MEKFFKRHFKRKTARPSATEGSRHRRTSVATGKARRRSNTGLPSATLAQRRRSSVQLQDLPLCIDPLHSMNNVGTCRRRSSTTAPGLISKMVTQKKRGAKMRAIDSHLLGPSMFLASLIRVHEDNGEAGPGVPTDIEVGSDVQATEDCEASEAESGGQGSSLEEGGSWSELSPSGSEGDATETDEDNGDDDYVSENMQHLHCSPGASIALRPFVRGPRCLRRSSSHLLPADCVYSKSAYGLYGHYRRISQRNNLCPKPRSLAGHVVGRAGPCARRRALGGKCQKPEYVGGEGAPLYRTISDLEDTSGTSVKAEAEPV